MQRRAIGTAIVRGDANDDRVLIFFRRFNEDVEVAAVVEDAGIDQLELRIACAATPVLLYQL